MDRFQQDLPQPRMSQTYAMTFAVVLILALGAGLFIYLAGDVVREIVASVK